MLVGSLAFSPSAYAAGNASFTASGSGAYTVGNNVGVTVYENGIDVRSVSVYYSYDSSKLQFIGTDVSGSAFSEGFASGNSVTRYITPGSTTTVNGSAKVATLNFKAVASGTATVTVGVGDSSISTDGTVEQWNGSASNASFTIAAAAATTQPTPATSTPTKTTTTPKTASTTTVPQVAGAEDTKPADVATTSDTSTKDSSNKAAITVTTDNSSNTGTWVAGSVAVILVAATAAYFWLTRRHPEYLKYISKKINL